MYGEGTPIRYLIKIVKSKWSIKFEKFARNYKWIVRTFL